MSVHWHFSTGWSKICLHISMKLFFNFFWNLTPKWLEEIFSYYYISISWKLCQSTICSQKQRLIHLIYIYKRNGIHDLFVSLIDICCGGSTGLRVFIFICLFSNYFDRCQSPQSRKGLDLRRLLWILRNYVTLVVFFTLL